MNEQAIANLIGNKQVLDPETQKQLLHELKQGTESDQLHIIFRLLELDAIAAFAIARRLQHSRVFNQAIVRHGVASANRSTIKDFLDYGKATMGGKALVALLQEYRAHRSEAIEGVKYWLPSYADDDDHRLQIRSLIEELK